MGTSKGVEATSFSEQAPAARRDYFASSNSGAVRQDARDVGDVVEKFTGAPRVRGVTPRSGVVIVGVGPPPLRRPSEPTVPPSWSRSHCQWRVLQWSRSA